MAHVLQSECNAEDSLVIENVYTLPDLLRWQSQRRGDAPLLSFRPQQQSDLITVSYADAYTRSYTLARSLRHAFPASETANPVVGVLFERSIELHLALFATTISGAAWLPFDADVPTERVTACLQDSSASILLCDESHRKAASRAIEKLPACRLITFEQLTTEEISTMETQADLPRPQPSDTAYIIYTSGSSGTPKGIEIPHHAALTFSLSERSILETGPEDVVWQGFSAAFDMFIEETWVSIAGGAHLAIGSRTECQDVPRLGGASGIWAEREVTVVNTVPTLINIMTSLDDNCRLPSKVRLLNLGGEACPLALVNRLWSPSLRIVNTYGPSETTVTATFKELLPEQTVTIGKPLPGYHALLLPVIDELPDTWAPLEILEGVEGELTIGGECLGKGYVDRPSLTSEKFIEHPLSSTPGQRLYRTGDRVRLDHNLDIVFLGRIDAQVKHRGFRIELGEIEHAIAACPTVQTAAVILSTTSDRLEAYIVAQDGAAVDVNDVRASVRQLPSYMHPEAFVFLSAEALPRLPSGKINARALQDVSSQKASITAHLNKSANISLVAYADPDRDLFMRTMAEVLPQSEKMTESSDLFTDLGCHSLLAASLVSKLRKESPDGSIFKQLGLQDIYIQRTADKIVSSLGSRAPEGKQAKVSEEDDTYSDLPDIDHWPVSRLAVRPVWHSTDPGTNTPVLHTKPGNHWTLHHILCIITNL